MTLYQLYHYYTPHTNASSSSINNENNENKKIQQKCRILNRLTALVFFTIGAIIEAYTFSKTGSISESTGIGWGTFLAFCIINISN